jgi:hypothetical protein
MKTRSQLLPDIVKFLVFGIMFLVTAPIILVVLMMMAPYEMYCEIKKNLQ